MPTNGARNQSSCSAINLQLVGSEALRAALLLLCLLIMAENRGAEATGQLKPKFCGKALNDVLDLVCTNGFNTLKMKRCTQAAVEDFLAEEEERLTSLREDVARLLRKLRRYMEMFAQQTELEEEEQQLLTALRNRTKRRRRYPRLGIVHECCFNGCIFADIAKYCR